LLLQNEEEKKSEEGEDAEDFYIVEEKAGEI